MIISQISINTPAENLMVAYLIESSDPHWDKNEIMRELCQWNKTSLKLARKLY